MLLTMLESEDEEERRFAVNVIKKIKKGADLGDFLPRQIETPSTLMQPTCKHDQLGNGEALGALSDDHHDHHGRGDLLP